MALNPIPSRHFDELVEEEIKSLASLLAASGKSVTIVVVAASAFVAETYAHSVVKPSERGTILGGLERQAERIREGWQE